jgi:hypothetical protein
MTLFANIRLNLKGLPGKNTTAYFKLFYIADIKGFITLGPGVDVTKLFFFVTDAVSQ